MQKHHAVRFFAYEDIHQGAYVSCRCAVHTSRARNISIRFRSVVSTRTARLVERAHSSQIGRNVDNMKPPTSSPYPEVWLFHTKHDQPLVFYGITIYWCSILSAPLQEKKDARQELNRGVSQFQWSGPFHPGGGCHSNFEGTVWYAISGSEVQLLVLLVAGCVQPPLL